MGFSKHNVVTVVSNLVGFEEIRSVTSKEDMRSKLKAQGSKMSHV